MRESTTETRVDHRVRWDLFRYFLAVSKTSSVTGAAQWLRESPPTVSRRIRELERLCAVSLFNRGPGALRLTPAGEQLINRLAPVSREMDAIFADLDGSKQRMSGRVTITAPRGFGHTVLMRCLRDLRDLLPDVEFETVFQTKKLSMRNRDADIAIRFGASRDQDDMHARRLGVARFALYASATYMQTREAPRTIADLRQLDYIELTEAPSMPQNVEMRAIAPGLRSSLKVDCILLQSQSVANGLGFAPLPKYMAAHLPDAVELLPGAMMAETEVWALSHVDTNRNACVAATMKPLMAATREALAS